VLEPDNERRIKEQFPDEPDRELFSHAGRYAGLARHIRPVPEPERDGPVRSAEGIEVRAARDQREGQRSETRGAVERDGGRGVWLFMNCFVGEDRVHGGIISVGSHPLYP